MKRVHLAASISANAREIEDVNERHAKTRSEDCRRRRLVVVVVVVVVVDDDENSARQDLKKQRRKVR